MQTCFPIHSQVLKIYVLHHGKASPDEQSTWSGYSHTTLCDVASGGIYTTYLLGSYMALMSGSSHTTSNRTRNVDPSFGPPMLSFNLLHGNILHVC